MGKEATNSVSEWSSPSKNIKSPNAQLKHYISCPESYNQARSRLVTLFSVYIKFFQVFFSVLFIKCVFICARLDVCVYIIIRKSKNKFLIPPICSFLMDQNC